MEAGSRLGPYEIIAPIGAGGMGEVYRARDTRVDRDVAIKILPRELAEDADRLTRFEQEARATAALNHPNLLTIHDLGRIGDRPYLVFELLEGSTLRTLIGESSTRDQARISATSGSGPRITPRKAVRHAVEIANGLAAAHDRGVIHRDLKPENIYVTTDGRLKILDFGLAVTPAMFAEGFEEAETMQRVTDPGRVVGTVGYMSPEQVRGQDIDSRTDIFSFGIVLYEMLLGCRPFRGESAADVMSAILHADPPEVDRLSLGLKAIVERCLEKNREERFRSAHDLALALEAVADSSRSLSLPVLQDEPRLPLPGRPGLILLGVALLVLGSIVGYFAGTSAAEERTVQPPKLRQLTYRAANEWHPSLSPDASLLAYVSDRDGGDDDVWLQRVGGENAINLTAASPESDTQPAFSPTGEQIAFRSERSGGGIWLMGATGESARRIADFGFNPAWSPDATTLLVAEEKIADPAIRNSSSSIWKIDVASGEAERVETGMDAVQPSWSPDGRWIAFWGLPVATGRRVIAVVPAAGGEPRIIIDDGNLNWSPLWAPDSKSIVFASDRGGAMNLWRIGFQPSSGTPRGAPVPVTTSPLWNGQPAIAFSSGSIAFVTKHQQSAIDRLPFDRRTGITGPPVNAVSSARDIWSAHPSPRGDLLAFKAVDRNEDLFLADMNGEVIRRLTDDPEKDRWPAWSPNGDRLYFFSDRTGQYEIWSIGSDGGQLTRETYSKGDGPVYPEIAPDGTQLLVTYFHPGRVRAAILDMGMPPRERAPSYLPPIDEQHELFTPQWSPDGLLLAGVSRSRDGSVLPEIWIFDHQRVEYRKVAENARLSGWLDPSTLLSRSDGKFQAIDVVTGEKTVLGEVPDRYMSFALGPDEGSIYGVENAIRTDLWMVGEQ